MRWEDESTTLLIRLRHEILTRAWAYDLTLAQSSLNLVLWSDASPMVSHPFHAMLPTKVNLINHFPQRFWFWYEAEEAFFYIFDIQYLVYLIFFKPIFKYSFQNIWIKKLRLLSFWDYFTAEYHYWWVEIQKRQMWCF